MRKTQTETEPGATPADARPTKRQIVCRQLGLDPASCSHGDGDYVEEFESRFGELTVESFREFCDDAEFTEWAIATGY